METQNTNKVVFLGTTDEVTTCDCCGRANLKKTIALLVNDFPVYYGSACAENALGRPNYEIKRATKHADKMKNPEYARGVNARREMKAAADAIALRVEEARYAASLAR
jgi:hypothetical protein